MTIRQLKSEARRLRYAVAHKWNTSLQIRVIGSIFVVCALVVLILGLSMISIMTQRLVDAKLDIANSEIDRARVTVEQQISSIDSATSLQLQVNSARSALAARAGGPVADKAAVYEPVVVVNSDNDADVISSPEGYQIPPRLRRFVSEGQVSYQFTMVDKEDGSSVKSLIIGTPTDSGVPELQVYLVLSMENEEQTLALMRGLFAAGGVVLLVLLVGISWLLTQQITGPVRSASRIAQRFANGHFRERMVVDGEDEMARMAMSFNSMAEELSKQIDQLKEYGDLQRQFTSDVSHELSTPLTSVRMAAELIVQQREDLDPLTQHASDVLIRELDRFEALLKDLLEISKHDAGVATLSASEVDVRSVITSAWKQVKHLAEQVGVSVRFDLPQQPVMATVDARRVERILRNLVANAIDHSEGKPVLVRLRANDEAVALAVCDNGVGLKSCQEELVFERFWRADPSRKRHSGGTGLGLAMSREDAQLHGGSLEAIGELGVGTMFRLTVPRRPHEEYGESPLPLDLIDTSISVGVTELHTDEFEALAANTESDEVAEDGVDKPHEPAGASAELPEDAAEDAPAQLPTGAVGAEPATQVIDEITDEEWARAELDAFDDPHPDTSEPGFTGAGAENQAAECAEGQRPDEPPAVRPPHRDYFADLMEISEEELAAAELEDFGPLEDTDHLDKPDAAEATDQDTTEHTPKEEENDRRD
ncbi:Sensor histidine kinase MtrB [Corynebacterium ciconiae DSM 44920]|uniref:MtrAB system histidine kinase MtrB n=1 Tax=Corynebacterium ciconiae TaxID=227319 RepID=UPI000370D35A|nr:MtrAB system histidine kinase MtrB [Corynebacterium ciconiae]WKD61804.1 Sensor histidine kinase MtrB [Corynebacterium ciconiae DSM 44920]